VRRYRTHGLIAAGQAVPALENAGPRAFGHAAAVGRDEGDALVLSVEDNLRREEEG
jgi:hypothetical protein